MNRISCIVCGCIIIGLITLFTIAFVVTRKWEQENFSGGEHSTRSLYMKSDNVDTFDSDVQVMSTTLKDRMEPLLMKRCYQLPPRKKLKMNCYNYEKIVQTNRFDMVVSKIKDDIKMFRRKIRRRIKGSVYVLVTQAPYMRDANGKEMVVQYHIGSYLQSPVNVMKNEEQNTFDQQLMFYYRLYFTNYSDKAFPRLTPFDVLKYLKKYESSKSQCYVSCANDSMDSYCGCMNLKLPYKASCVATPLTGSQDKAEPADFTILYEVNPNSTLFANDDLFA